MDDIYFYKSFWMRVLSFKDRLHTDNSAGISCHYLAKMIHGKASFNTLDGQVMKVSEGDVFYLPRGLRYHSYWQGDGEGRISWLSISFGCLPREDTVELLPQTVRMGEEETRLLDGLMQAGLPSLSGIGLLYSLMSRLIPKMVRRKASDCERVVSLAIEYMKAHRQMRVPELARYCGVSESGIYALIKRATGSTPITLFNKIKAEAATELLMSTGMTVEEIAGEMGFENVGYFRKVFKSATKMTPSKARKGRRLI